LSDQGLLITYAADSFQPKAVKELSNEAIEELQHDSDAEESEGNVLEREVDKMLKEMMCNPIARNNVISPVNNDSGGNQVSFKKQNPVLDNSVQEIDEDKVNEIDTHHTSLHISPSEGMLSNNTSEKKKQKERKKTLVRLGIRDEADLIKGHLECVKLLIIQDFIIVVCKNLKIKVYKKDVIEGYYLNETIFK